MEEKEFPTYLVVVSSTGYLFLLIWEALHLKGYRLLRKMLASPDRWLRRRSYVYILYVIYVASYRHDTIYCVIY